MFDRKNALVFLGGIAVGGISCSLLWKYRRSPPTSSVKCVLRTISESECWPFVNETAIEPKAIHVISDREEFKDDIIKGFLAKVNEVKVLGFDCEWTSANSKPNPIGLLQLATSDYICYLIRTNKLCGLMPKEILNVLQDRTILKVGVGVRDDASKLLRDHGIQVNGCLDLRALATRYQLSDARGLKSLAKELVNITLDKSYHLRCSNWDADELSDVQIRYAAFDVFSAVKIFEALITRKLAKNPPSKKEINQAAQRIIWHTVRSSVQGLVDMTFKENKSFQSIKCNDLKAFNNNTKASTGIPKNPKLFKSMKTYSTRQQPLYDNCKLQAPDGQLLSTCDRKKAQWYLQKNLAELIADEPFTIRLYFEPAGRPDDDRDYYLYEKENKCVVCGSMESFVRKNVVPHEYRKHFALAMKDHTSHDILLLCLPCHQQSNYYDCLLRRELADEFKAPQGSIQAMRLFEDPERRSVRSAGRALLQAKDQLPDNRRNELEKTIEKFFQTTELTTDMIKKASELETRIENEAYIPHGEKVVLTIFKADGTQGILNFEKRWREHFLKNMKPKFLPPLWSVDHNHKKAKKKWNEMEDEYKRKIEVQTSARTD